VVPDVEDRAYVHDRYLGELTAGIFRAETRAGVLAVVNRMKLRDGIDGVVLGGTELPLLFRDGEAADVAMLDTTRIHVERAIDRLIAYGTQV
jgi:aspartate racemase